MSLMSKLLTSTAIVSVVLNAGTLPDNKALVRYIQKNVVINPEVNVKGVTVLETKNR